MSNEERVSYDDLVELIVDAQDVGTWSCTQERKILLALKELRQRREDDRVAESLTRAAVHIPALERSDV